MNNTYCVYSHIRKDNNTIFYIGMGKNIKRAYKKEKSARNNHWFNIVKKHGYSVNIIKDNLSKEEAIELEKELIIKYGRYDLNKGSLCNKTDGGEGCFNPIKVNGSKKVINIYTKEIFNSITEASKSQDRTFCFLSYHLNSKDNKSDFVFLKDYNGQSKPIIHYYHRKEKIINKDTLEIFKNVKEAAKSMNIDGSGLSKKLRGVLKKNDTPFEYLRKYNYDSK